MKIGTVVGVGFVLAMGLMIGVNQTLAGMDHSKGRRMSKLARAGSAYGGWTYDSAEVDKFSIVYSVGLGEDTTFDETMMERYGLEVWGFDPTPKSIKYVQSNAKLAVRQFHFTAEGLSTAEKQMVFTKPTNENHVSMHQGRDGSGGKTVVVKVNSLANWMKKFGHSEIDILKIDIEGSEYDVIEDCIKRQWFPMRQLLVEFHPGLIPNRQRHVGVLTGLKRAGFEVLHNESGKGLEMSFRRRWVAMPNAVVAERKSAVHVSVFGRRMETIPIVMVVLNTKMNNVLRKNIPVWCVKNTRVVVLTNKKEEIVVSGKTSCLEIVDVSEIYKRIQVEMPWPKGSQPQEKIFFHRWYVIRDWMRESRNNVMFTMDSDAMMTQNITALVAENLQTIEKNELWLYYNPPRSSGQCLMSSLAALEDMTNFFNQLLLTDTWTPELIKSKEPNDMVAIGHYVHSAVGRPYPCWGLSVGQKDGTCDDSMSYGHTKVLDKLASKGVAAKFAPGTLSLDRHGHAPFAAGVFDNNYRHDPLQRYEMKDNSKQLRFWQGTPQFKLRTGKWMSLWGYVLEDEMESCVDVHLKHIIERTTCVCLDMCCRQCMPEEVGKLTVWSLWKNNFAIFLAMHVKFYVEYWKADSLFLNVGCDGKVRRSEDVQTILRATCGSRVQTVAAERVGPDAFVDRFTCLFGQVDVLYYQSEYNLTGDPELHANQKKKLMRFYDLSYDSTPRKMYVDHDEFFVPADGDVSVRSQEQMVYHIVDVKPVYGVRDWSAPLEWVDQPYYYRMRYLKKTYPHDNWDGSLTFSTLDRRSHIGPFKEHDGLRACALGGPVAYAGCVRNYNIMYHFSVHDEEYFMNSKHFDQTTEDGTMKPATTFPDYFVGPEKDFVVFKDEFLRAFVPIAVQ